jgi:hypothetical protein
VGAALLAVASSAVVLADARAAALLALASVAVVLADARAVRTDTRKLKCVFHTYFSVI